MGKSPKTNPTTRFAGNLGKVKIREALLLQNLVGGSLEIAEAIIKYSSVVHLKAAQSFIQQDDYDTDMYFIILGSVDIVINGTKINQRDSCSHVGEMALLDPMSKRSATVITREATVLLKISEPNFTKIANQHPYLWRKIASSLASRLRERSNGIPIRNAKPKVFIGSSSEGSAVLNFLKKKLRSPKFQVIPWTKGVFEPSGTTIESLIKISRDIDFAVLVFTPDDKNISRGLRSSAPRDNVLFELGLFMGAIGRERAFVIKPAGRKLKTPSDLLGFTCLELQYSSKGFNTDCLDGLAKELSAIVSKKGAK